MSSAKSNDHEEQKPQMNDAILEIVKPVIAMHSPVRYSLSDVASAATLLPLKGIKHNRKNHHADASQIHDTGIFSHIGVEMQYPAPVQRRPKMLSTTVPSDTFHANRSSYTKPTEVLILKMLISRPENLSTEGGVDHMKQEAARVAFLKDGHVVAFGLTEPELYALRRQGWLQECEDQPSSIIQAAVERGSRRVKTSFISNPPVSAVQASNTGSFATVAESLVHLGATAANATYNDETGDTLIHMRYTTVEAMKSLSYGLPAGVDAPYIDEGPLSAIVLKDESPLNKLPFLYCLSAVATIEALERRLISPAHAIRGWQDHVLKTGKLNFSTNEARRIQSILHTLQLQQARVGQRPALFAHPDYGQHRQVYNQAYDYYEIDERTDALGDSIESVQNSLKYLVSESHAKVNHDLEVVIVVLIAVEIFIHLFLPRH